MASSLPIIRQVAWLSVVPQVVLMLGLVSVAQISAIDEPFLVGTAAYLLLLFTLRSVIAKHHRAGVKLFKQERFAEATHEFEKSYRFFSEHSWLDRWRAITVLSSSRVSYREMALLNLAFCLAQSGQKAQALATYQKALAEFPEGKLAPTAIRMLDGGSTTETGSS